jgi:hypothetical protein
MDTPGQLLPNSKSDVIFPVFGVKINGYKTTYKM